jgi:hypothetical protein
MVRPFGIDCKIDAAAGHLATHSANATTARRRVDVSPSTISRALSGHDVKRPATWARPERIRALAATV